MHVFNSFLKSMKYQYMIFDLRNAKEEKVQKKIIIIFFINFVYVHTLKLQKINYSLKLSKIFKPDLFLYHPVIYLSMISWQNPKVYSPTHRSKPACSHLPRLAQGLHNIRTGTLTYLCPFCSIGEATTKNPGGLCGTEMILLSHT